MIGEDSKQNFATLLRAVANSDVCLVECLDKQIGSSVVVLCAINTLDEGQEQLIPLARMLDQEAVRHLFPVDPTSEIESFPPPRDGFETRH